MALSTKRWNEPPDRSDGTRILVTRFRPRGLRKGKETWSEWDKRVSPSPQLIADFHGKTAEPIGWPEFRARYLQEMKNQVKALHELAERLKGGESLTLLCSSACHDPARCHRTLLARLIAEGAGLDWKEEAEEKPKSESRSRLLDWIG